MSTLKVNNVQDLGADAVVTNGVIASGALPAGSVLGLVSTPKTDTFSASIAAGANTAVTGLSVTHSLSSSTNKVYITVNIGSTANSFTTSQTSFAVNDGTNFLYVGDSALSRPQVSVSSELPVLDRGAVSHSFSFLHSPGTTSPITYTVHIFNTRGATQTVYVNRNWSDSNDVNSPRSASSITLMEVAA